MRERGRWLDPLEAFARQIELAEERRRSTERMECRADVVDEPGKGQLARAAAAADRLVRFVDGDGMPVAREPASENANATADSRPRCGGRHHFRIEPVAGGDDESVPKPEWRM